MRWKVLVLVPFILAAALIGYQVTRNGAYHCGRCGTQQWLRHFLWMDFSEYNYDEYGIQKRWECAHTRPCEHIWRRGPLMVDGDPEYWPRLHFRVAAGAKVDVLKALFEKASNQELSIHDQLGRTVAHWLFIHPDRAGRQELIEMLRARSIDLNVRDADGLTPQDWQSNCDEASSTSGSQ